MTSRARLIGTYNYFAWAFTNDILLIIQDLSVAACSRSVILFSVFHSRHLRSLLPFWIAVLVIGSFLPAGTKQALGTQSGAGSYGTPTASHRIWHIASFGSTALLAALVAHSPGGRLLAAGGLFGLAISIELLQQIVFASDLEWWDIRDDGYGIIALTVTGWIGRVRRVLLKS